MKFEGKTFINWNLTLDDNYFFECVFESCLLVYRGGNLPYIVGCTFRKTHLYFSEAAANTLLLMGTMGHGGLTDRALVGRNWTVASSHRR